MRRANKKTIDVMLSDYDYMFNFYKNPVGNLSIADMFKDMVKAHKFCIMNKIDYRALPEGELEVINKKVWKERESERL